MVSETNANFEDIRIVGLDKQNTHNPDPRMALYHIYFTLSDHPPLEWIQIFENERRFPRHTMWRRAWVEGGNIVVEAPLDEIEKYHLPDLKEDVPNTNTKYRDYLQKREALEAKQQAAEEEEHRRLDDLDSKLSFN